MAIAKLVFEILAKIGPGLFDYIKALIDGGADAAKLRQEPLEVSIAFGGQEGHVIKIQGAIESDMANPNAE